MDFTQSLCISKGPRAGLPKSSTDVVMDAGRMVKGVTVLLKRNGFEVIGWSVNSSVQPVIQVAYSRLCEKMIIEDEATYYLYRANERHGQFVVDGVRVVWVERFQTSGGH